MPTSSLFNQAQQGALVDFTALNTGSPTSAIQQPSIFNQAQQGALVDIIRTQTSEETKLQQIAKQGALVDITQLRNASIKDATIPSI